MPRWLPYAVAALFAVYLPLATWVKLSYVDPFSRGREVVLLGRPFERFGTAAVAHYWNPRASLDDLTDTPEDNERSPVLIYEDDEPLTGPAHSSHADIAKIGMGRYSHWTGQGFVFSSSDNTDPNTNGRRYWAVVP